MFRSWLQLFRAPNLFTVPGDPIAGFLIATGGFWDIRAAYVASAALCLYGAGLAMNDLADFGEDSRDRPSRPLPSGAIKKHSAIAATMLLIALALLLLRVGTGPRSLIVGVLLLATIIFYNFIAKRITLLGPLAMGACRGTSLLMGATAGISIHSEWLASISALHPILGLAIAPESAARTSLLFTFALIAALVTALYISAVTALARHETKPTYPRLLCFLPLGALLIGFLALKQVTGPLFLDQSPTLWLMAIVLCAIHTSQIIRIPAPPLAPRIGGFIRLLLILQAAFCLAPSVPTRLQKTPESFLCALLLLAMVPLSSRLGRRFYAS